MINCFLFNFEQKTYGLNEGDLSVLYYAHVYLKGHAEAFPQGLVEMVYKYYSEYLMKSKRVNFFFFYFFLEKQYISMVCFDISKHLEAIQVPNTLEANLDNIMVDIIVPKSFLGKQVIIEVNGNQHYFRNYQHIKGSQELKRKIIEGYGNIYQIIPVIEWDIL